MSAPQAAKPPAVLEGITPILAVRDLQASIDHYVRVLGFKLGWHHHGIIASVSRDQCSIMLSEGDQGQPGTWVWIGAGDIEPLFEEYRTKGAKVRHPPTNYSWAYEMQIEDPDGHVLRFGSEPKPGLPVGEWLDAHGERWVMSAPGEWKRVK